MAGEKLTPQVEAGIKKLGEKITARRKALGYSSYEQFAVAKNLNRGMYWRYEKGENMKLSNVAKVAEALEIPVTELLSGCF